MAKRGKKKSAKTSTTRKGKTSTVTTVMTTKTTKTTKTTRRSNPRRRGFRGRYLIGEVTDRGLRIKPTEEGREEAQEAVEERRTHQRFYDMFEDWIGNGWIWIPPSEIGALTDAPIISPDAYVTDDGEIAFHGASPAVYWHERYQIEDPVAVWAEGGSVPFDLARDSNPAKAKNARRPNAMGRHYADDEWAEFILEGHLETVGASRDDTSIPPMLADKIKQYERLLRRVLAQCLVFAQSHMPQESRVTIDDIWSEGTGAPYAVLMTLRGEGVGIWDGRWDHWFDKATLTALQQCLESDRELGAVADVTGGGWLNEAFNEAAYERMENPSGRRGRSRRNNPQAAVGSMSSSRIRSIADRLARGGD